MLLALGLSSLVPGDGELLPLSEVELGGRLLNRRDRRRWCLKDGCNRSSSAGLATPGLGASPPALRRAVRRECNEKSARQHEKTAKRHRRPLVPRAQPKGCWRASVPPR